VRAEIRPLPEPLPPALDVTAYRLLQEALTNVLRHAGAVPVRVRVAVGEGTLALEVRNPLPAAIPGPGRGSGLRGIRERAALLGGTARTGPDEGEWEVCAELPIN
jgi:signal transduction histidine kinase